MGPLELGEIAKAKAVRAKIYESGYVELKPVPAVFYQQQPCSPDCDWARAMRIDGFSHVTVERIIQAVCEYYGCTEDQIKSGGRSVSIIVPRHVAMYLARHLTKQSLYEIGKELGNRHHTTVLHGVRHAEQMVRDDKELNRDVKFIRKELVGNAYWKIEGLD